MGGDGRGGGGEKEGEDGRTGEQRLRAGKRRGGNEGGDSGGRGSDGDWVEVWEERGNRREEVRRLEWMKRREWGRKRERSVEKGEVGSRGEG